MSEIRVDTVKNRAGTSTITTADITNAPMFHAYHTSTVSGVTTGLSNESNVIYKPNLTSINIDNRFDTSTGRFTPTVAGKYFCYGTISPYSATSGFERTIIRVLV